MFDKSKLGYSFPPFTITIERNKIHELTTAIGDENPIYHDLAAAQAAGYADIPLSPTAPTIFTFWGNTQIWEQLTGVGINVTRLLHGEEEYEYLEPIAPGDTLTGVTTIVDGKSRKTKEGSMDIVTTETRYTNQHQQHVLSAKTVFVVRE
jgi:acyl dehydratase